MSAALELAGISKRYGEVVASDGVDLVVETQTVHALVGENGAGKSTLMKIAYGEVRADAGRLAIHGEDVALASHDPSAAIVRGLGMVHQHFMLVETLSVVENIVLGREPMRGLRVDIERARQSLKEISLRFGLAIDPDARIGDLGVGEQQRVEIVKALYQGCDILILDEPTAVLSPGEARDLFAVLRELVAESMTIVLITHKLDEVVSFADEVTVMRGGQRIEQHRRDAGLSDRQIARAMVGRDVAFERPERRAPGEEPVLEVEGLSVASSRGMPAVESLDLVVHSGEIVGIAGVEGNGQTELIEALMGLRRPSAGQVRLLGETPDGADITAWPVGRRYRAGVGHVPADRHRRALVLGSSLDDNLLLGRQWEVARHGFLDRAAIRERARETLANAGVHPPDPALRAAALSGGNQQKLVVARELGRPGLRLLLCAHPTRGVDIGAIEDLHGRLMSARNAGVAILLVSSELSELERLSDRILVIYRGRWVVELGGDELSSTTLRDRLGAAMTGALA